MSIQCSFERRVAQFAKYGRVADILAYLRQVSDLFCFGANLHSWNTFTSQHTSNDGNFINLSLRGGGGGGLT